MRHFSVCLATLLALSGCMKINLIPIRDGPTIERTSPQSAPQSGDADGEARCDIPSWVDGEKEGEQCRENRDGTTTCFTVEPHRGEVPPSDLACEMFGTCPRMPSTP